MYTILLIVLINNKFILLVIHETIHVLQKYDQILCLMSHI